MTWEWLPALTAPMGAAIGAAVGFSLGRPRLSVTIDRIRISPSRAATSLPVPVHGALSQSVRRFPGGLPQIERTWAPERVYITWLEMVREEIEDANQNFDQQLRIASQLRQYASNEEYTQMIDLYLDYHRVLWIWAEGENRRGKSVFSSPAWNSPELTDTIHEMHLVETDEYSGYQVRFPGVIQCFFNWQTKDIPEARIVRAKEFAYRVSTALATHSRADLMEYFGGTRDILAEAKKQIEEINEQVQSELSKYARLQIEMLVSNSGRSGVSISSDIDCRVYLKGYRAPTGTVQADPIIRLNALPQEMAESIRTAAKDAAPGDLRVDEFSPIVIQAGQTIRLIAASEFVIDKYGDGAALRAAYTAAERRLRLSLIQFRQRVGRKSVTEARRSRKVLFRDLTPIRATPPVRER